MVKNYRDRKEKTHRLKNADPKNVSIVMQNPVIDRQTDLAYFQSAVIQISGLLKITRKEADDRFTDYCLLRGIPWRECFREVLDGVTL